MITGLFVGEGTLWKMERLLYGAQVHGLHDLLQLILGPDFPEIVTLCGSTRFKKEYEDELARLTLEGKIVISVGLLGHHTGLDMESQVKKDLDTLHLRKIDIASRIHVINGLRTRCKQCLEWSDTRWSCHCMAGQEKKPYIGDSTRSEINYAMNNHKAITYMVEQT
jgi:hypothetical protein